MSELIPKEAFHQHMIALGKTGAGKSSAVRKIVEGLLDDGARVIVITPKADWWGIKLSADGKHAGYPVVVFGGEHSDMPLNHTSGKMMAELLATGNRSAVLQMRDFMPSEREQFWGDFAANLFRLLVGKLYLVIDEVHNFAPKGKVEGRAATMLHWSNKLASESRGLGITLIAASQRPAKVHNDFLTSCETLIAMRVTTKWDREAIKDWIEGCGDKDRANEVLNSLAQMKRGDAWVWSPEIEFGPKQIHFPMFETYDSFKPQEPKAVEKLSGWAEVNLDDVRKKLEHVVKEAEANDPKKLRARIAELERQARTSASSASNEGKKTEVDPKAIERAIRPLKQLLGEAMKIIVKVNAIGFEDAGVTAEQIQQALAKTAAEISRIAESSLKRKSDELERLKIEAQRLMVRLQKAVENEDLSVDLTVRRNEPVTVVPTRHTAARASLAHGNGHSNGDGNLDGPQRRILTALAELRAIGKEVVPREMCAAWASYSAIGGAFGNPAGKLNKTGLIRYPSNGYVEITNEGLSAIGEQTPPTLEEVRQRIYSILDGPERKILTALLDHGKEEIARDDLAANSGYAPVGGAFGNPMGSLRTKGLLDYPSKGTVQAAEWLFEA